MKNCVFFYLAFIFSLSANAQIITTIMGTGMPSFGGDAGPATAAYIYRAYGIAIDVAGNIFIADHMNGRIRKMDASGIINTIAGTGASAYSGDGIPATTANFSPEDVAIDMVGNIYIPDVGNNRIRKVDTAGFISTIAGTGTAGYSGDGGPATAATMNAPSSVTVDKWGNLYFAEGDDAVRKVNTSGVITTVAGNGIQGYSGDAGPATLAQLHDPYGIAVDDAGNVYIAEVGNHRIRKVNTSGIITTIAGSGPSGLGMGSYSGDAGPATNATLNTPWGVFADHIGNVYIADANNNVVRKINTSGIITTIAGTGVAAFGGDGMAATAAQMYRPYSVKLDDTGNMYIADTWNNRVRLVKSGNHIPAFTGGSVQLLSVCHDVVAPINTLLSVADADMGQPLTWMLAAGPAHGTVAAAYSGTSTGGTLSATGLSYTPAAGYTGADTFRVRVDDGISVATTVVCVTIDVAANAGTITGADSVCVGDTVSLSDIASGGTWSSSNTATCTIGSTGKVTGVAPGTSMITYAVTNSCGTATTVYPFAVRTLAACLAGMASVAPPVTETFNVFPNPATDGSITVTISSAVQEEARIIIINTLGEKIMEFGAYTNKAVDVRLPTPSGIYFVNGFTAHGAWSSRVTLAR